MGPYMHQRNQPMSLLIRKLKYDTSPSMVREKFKKFGAIKDVYLPIDYYTKEPRGFGFVEFYDPKDAEQALKEMNGSEIDGNRIEVFVAQKGRSDPRLMRYKEKGGGIPPGPYPYRKYSDYRIRKRYISKSNSRHRSYSRDKIRRRDDRSRERFRYRNSYDRRMDSYRDKKSYYPKSSYNKYRNKDYDRSCSRSRRSRDYRNESPRYKEKRRYDKYYRSSSRRVSRGGGAGDDKYERRSRHDRKDNYKSKYDSNDEYSDETRNSSKHSKKQHVSKSISFNTDKEEARKKTDNANDKDNSKDWRESEERNDEHSNRRESVNSQDEESNLPIGSHFVKQGVIQKHNFNFQAYMQK
ncbi:Ser/Arg-rich splicing factor [Plasmodium cynomolgi strain B]|uniref:Ser/Arg-rich splicing factor n=1 Tax=Plasmodium cynomolgi (strain B) TaxID=1120755 RepID=K6VCW1_PLACD|nr:Ser/Arg-rich splicing factor [Plasmodium cynomolgi strain B]GAB67032.1 Ser/Arg-rich splicing factor [Plasmodium cynomolgi strain B]